MLILVLKNQGGDIVENLTKKILKEIDEWARTSAIRKEDLPLFIYELLYAIYSNKDGENLVGITTAKNIFELIEQSIKNNKSNKEEKKIKLLLEIQNDFEKFKYIELDYSSLFSILTSIDTNVIREIMKLDLTEKFGFPIYNMRGDFSTPKEIIALAKHLLGVTNDDQVLDMCSGIGDFLVDIASEYNCKLISGIDINMQSSLIAKIRLSVLTNNENIIMTGDALTHVFKHQYNKIFCNYPFGLRIDNYKLGEIKSRNNLLYSWDKYTGGSTDWIFVNTVISQLEPSGKAVMVMPDGPLFKIADKNYKIDLLNDGMIETIIKLPQNIFPSTMISLNLVVFSKQNNQKLRFIDATKEFEKKNNKNELLLNNILSLIETTDNDKVKTVEYKNIISNDAILTVDNYVGQKEIVYHNPHKLSDYLIDRFRGYQMTSSQQKELEDPNGEYEVLTISDIDNGNISDNLTKININDNKFDRYLIENGDIIISSKGTRIKIAVAEIGNRKIIANGNLIVLRIDQTKLNPYYLEMFLNSSAGQTILKQIQTGTVIISINPSRLASITISTLPFEEQNMIANKYKAKQKQITLAQEHIKKLENELDNFFEDEVEVLFE